MDNKHGTYIRPGASLCPRFLPSWPCCGGWKNGRIAKTPPMTARDETTTSGAASEPTSERRPAFAVESVSTVRRMKRMT